MNDKVASLWAGLWKGPRQTEPEPGCHDVEWDGPYYIQRPRQWRRSRFMLYGGTLFGSLEAGWSRLEAEWNLVSGVLSDEARTGSAGATAAEQIWDRAIPRLVRRLDAEVTDPGRYNPRVRRLLPIETRTGVARRRWSWPRGTRAPLSPREQHEAKADTRHGGLLGLKEDDPEAFRAWFASRVWSGSHPWEIVFGHPHGILLCPIPGDRGRWRHVRTGVGLSGQHTAEIRSLPRC